MKEPKLYLNVFRIGMALTGGCMPQFGNLFAVRLSANCEWERDALMFPYRTPLGRIMWDLMSQQVADTIGTL